MRKAKFKAGEVVFERGWPKEPLKIAKTHYDGNPLQYWMTNGAVRREAELRKQNRKEKGD